MLPLCHKLETFFKSLRVGDNYEDVAVLVGPMSGESAGLLISCLATVGSTWGLFEVSMKTFSWSCYESWNGARCIVQTSELPSIVPIGCTGRGGYYVNFGFQANLSNLTWKLEPLTVMSKKSWPMSRSFAPDSSWLSVSEIL